MKKCDTSTCFQNITVLNIITNLNTLVIHLIQHSLTHYCVENLIFVKYFKFVPHDVQLSVSVSTAFRALQSSFRRGRTNIESEIFGGNKPRWPAFRQALLRSTQNHETRKSFLRFTQTHVWSLLQLAFSCSSPAGLASANSVHTAFICFRYVPAKPEAELGEASVRHL